MRCYVFSDAISLDQLRLVERPDPVPGSHDIVLKMRAASLNFRDIAIVRDKYHVGVSPPLVPLSDGAGEVLQVGSAVTRFRIGDLACPTYGSRESLEGYVRAAERRKIRPVIAKVFPLEQIRDACDHVAQGGHWERSVSRRTSELPQRHRALIRGRKLRSRSILLDRPGASR